MQNISGLTQTHCAYNERRVTSVRNHCKRLAKHYLSKANLDQLKTGGITLLSTLTVGSLFLAGTYLFLVQLADYGW